MNVPLQGAVACLMLVVWGACACQQTLASPLPVCQLSEPSAIIVEVPRNGPLPIQPSQACSCTPPTLFAGLLYHGLLKRAFSSSLHTGIEGLKDEDRAGIGVGWFTCHMSSRQGQDNKRKTKNWYKAPQHSFCRLHLRLHLYTAASHGESTASNP